MKNKQIKTSSGYSFSSLMKLNLKRIYSTFSTRIIIIFSPFFVTFALAVVSPLILYIAVGQIFITTLSAGIIWGMTYFPYKNSTLKSNILLTKSNLLNIYLSIFLSMLLVTLFSQISFWFWSFLFDTINFDSLFEVILSNGKKQYDIVWVDIDWITIIYAWIVSIIIIFFMSLVFNGFLQNERKYFIWLFVFIFTLLPFGGVINPRILYDSSTNDIQINHGLNAASSIALLFPQTHINNWLYVALSPGIQITESDGTIHTMGYISKYDAFSWSSDWRWDLSVVYPWIIIAITSLLCYFKNKVYNL